MGIKPREEQLGLSDRQVSLGAEELICLAGVLSSFEQAADRVLEKMCGLVVSASTVERIAEGAGARLGEQVSAGQWRGPGRRWRWRRDAEGRRCGYVSVDATGVRQQGPGGSRAEGRMAYVAAVYNPRLEGDQEDRCAGEVRYLSGHYDLATLGRRLHDMALEVGWAEAEQQIAISDGGSGLEDFFRAHFPRAEVILDFWHAKEHLVELGKALYGEDEGQRQRWTDEACHRLKHEGGQAVVQWLEGVDVSGSSAAVQEEYRRQVQYFRNHQHKMDYPRYLANGWQIGSGPVESACKTVVGNRLKGGGMRWGEAGSHAICNLRALYLSEPCCWDAFWATPPPTAYLQN